MNLAYRTEPNPNDPRQIRLFVRCVSDAQAEALWRELRERFPQVSRRMASFDPAFSAFFYVRTSGAELQSVWAQIAGAVAPTTAPAGNAPARTAQRATSALGDLAVWDRTFRAVVLTVHEEIPRQSTAAQEVSLAWVTEQVRAGNAEVVESLLSQPTIHPASALRSQIALFSETGQYERVIALVESRRREVFALPASGLLAEQIVRAYLEFGRVSDVEDALRGAQQIASAMLPELERIRQAEGVRDLLRRALTPAEPPAEPTVPTLHELIAGIIHVEPADRISALEVLREDNAGAVELHLALGAAYAAAGRLDSALDTYAQAAPRDDEDRIKVLEQQAELLLDAGRHREAAVMLPDDEAMPPTLASLRGAALYGIGKMSEARTLLERAWQAGESRRAMLLPLARSRAAAGQHEGAIQVYRQILNNAPDMLEPQDLAHLATGLYVDRPDDIGIAQIADLCDRYVQQGGPTIRPGDEADDILALRVRLLFEADDGRWAEAQADRVEWLATQRRAEELRAELDALRAMVQRGLLARQGLFEVLEGAEEAALGSDEICAALAGEYQSIATAEVDAALLHNEPIPSYVRSIQRSLHFLSRAVADFIAEYIDDERAQLRQRNLEATEDVFAPEEVRSLSHLRLTVAGGHTSVRQHVADELRRSFGLTHWSEIAPSSEGRIDRDVVRHGTIGSDLIVVIAGYTGHDLTNILRDLQRAGQITGKVIWPACRGKSGVLREIVEAAKSLEGREP